MSARHLRAVILVLALAGCTADAPAGPTPGRPSFDGERAMELVRTQVAFGPRVPGRAGHDLQLDWMLQILDTLASSIQADTFSHVTTEGDSLKLVNVVASFVPEASRRILLLTHWDTRPQADHEEDPEQRRYPVPGANDGGSGTAVLLELARLLAEVPPPMGVDLLFVDGEDYGPSTDDMFLGARRFAAELGDGPRPVYGLLLDMVGDADPSFPVEGYSAQYADVVMRKVWRAAERLGHRSLFPDRVGERMGDDHLFLIQEGIPTADIIDFTYGPGNRYWHTREDRPEHVSAETLGIVGEVVAELLYSGG